MRTMPSCSCPRRNATGPCLSTFTGAALRTRFVLPYRPCSSQMHVGSALHSGAASGLEAGCRALFASLIVLVGEAVVSRDLCQGIRLLQNQMTRDVVAQLQRISGQQSKIQAMRNKLAIFREAAAKEDEMFAQLLVVRRIPAAYRQSLAECLRRWACPLSITCGLAPGRSSHGPQCVACRECSLWGGAACTGSIRQAG